MFQDLIVEVRRGQFIESEHIVHAVVSDFQKKTLMKFGEIDRLIFPRSAIKPLQALGIFFSGAQKQFNIKENEIALACASHAGEEIHTTAVLSWLKRMNLKTEHLLCGSHAPYSQSAVEKIYKKNEGFCPLHNNCSGKHTGLLAQTLASGADLKSYLQIDHPTQKKIKNTLENFYEYKLDDEKSAIDGCSIPTYLVPLKNLAEAMALWSKPKTLDIDLQLACSETYSAMVKYPELIAGTEQFCTHITKKLSGRGVVKVGAEGVMIAAFKEQGIGIALKAQDGTSARAVQVAVSWLIQKLGIMTQEESREFTHPKISNWNGIEVGHIQVRE